MKRKSRDRRKAKRPIPLVAHNHPKEIISEQYRLIRTNIMFSSIDKEIKSIMITSAGPSEGKSTTVVNLAIVFAQQGKKVLIIDADLRKPVLHFPFQLSNIHGLTSILTKESNLEDSILDSHIPFLDIMTSGPVPPNPSELLNSNAMENLMNELHAKYDLVIYDTPPVLSVTDAQILANRCDGVVVVVASGTTHRDRAVKAKEQLLKAKSKILGVIVNGIEQKKRESNYGSYI